MDLTQNSEVAEIQLSSRGFEYGVIHHLTKSKKSLRNILCQDLHIDEAKCDWLFELGAIYQNSHRLISKLALDSEIPEGTYLRVHTRPRRFDISALYEENRVIYENIDFLVYNKPSGVPCHATVDNTKENVIHILSQKLAFPLHITHRLDTSTHGLLILAKTKEFQTQFNLLLQQRLVKKIYQAQIRTSANWPPGTLLTHYMQPSPRAPKTLSLEPLEGWGLCQLQILNCIENLVTIHLLTGRTHQIRAQLSFEGHPIIGDHMYGDTSTTIHHDKIELKAANIEFLEYSFSV